MNQEFEVSLACVYAIIMKYTDRIIMTQMLQPKNDRGMYNGINRYQRFRQTIHVYMANRDRSEALPKKSLRSLVQMLLSVHYISCAIKGKSEL